MRVSSINAAGQQQVAFNGSFSKPVKALLDSQTPKLLEAKRLGRISKDSLHASFDRFTKDYEVMRSKMDEFSYSTVLSMSKRKDGSTLFYIEHPHSDYKYFVGNVYLGEELSSRIDGFSMLADMLKKVNPFEVENKFCIQRHSDIPRSFFKPEIKL